MTGENEKRILFAVSIICLLSLFVWLYYWLFVASLDSGVVPTVTIVNHPDGSQSFPVTYTYDSAQRYGPYIPLVVAGVFGALVGSIVGAIVFVMNKRMAHGNQPAVAIPISAGIGVFCAVTSSIAIGFVWLAFFDQSPQAGANSLLRGLAIILLVPGLCIFSGIPAFLGSVGTSCLLFGFGTNSRHKCVTPSSADPT